jgi:hypothetical protein
VLLLPRLYNQDGHPCWIAEPGVLSENRGRRSGRDVTRLVDGSSQHSKASWIVIVDHAHEVVVSVGEDAIAIAVAPDEVRSANDVMVPNVVVPEPMKREYSINMCSMFMQI